MTGDTKIIEYDQFFIKNYNYLLGFARSIDVKNDYESLVQDVYIKCRNRIKVNGYSGSTYLNYVRCSIMNYYKTSYRDKKYTIDYEQDDVFNEVENHLLSENEYSESQESYNNKMSFLNTMVFEYVDKFYTPQENMVFKTYYVLKHKHLNYQQLSKATGYSITTVSNIIKKIKKDLRINLLSYINTGYKVMELQEKIKLAEEVLKLPIGTYSTKYRAVYKECFGVNWSGCSCNINLLREQLKQWLAKNKVN